MEGGGSWKLFVKSVGHKIRVVRMLLLCETASCQARTVGSMASCERSSTTTGQALGHDAAVAGQLLVPSQASSLMSCVSMDIVTVGLAISQELDGYTVCQKLFRGSW